MFQRLEEISGRLRSRATQKKADWKNVATKVKEGRMNEISLNKRNLLKVAGWGLLGGLVASCTPKAVELLTATPAKKKEDEVKMHSGFLYKKDAGVLKIEDGFGVRATLEGFDYIPESQRLDKLALVGLKFGQGDPNGQALVKDRLAQVLPGLDEAMIANDREGTPISGLFSINKSLFVLTRVGEGANNSLAIFAPNPNTSKANPDGSTNVEATMIYRDNQAQWKKATIGGKEIVITLTLEFDANGNLKNYTVPVLNPSFEPTKEPEQRASVAIKNLSFAPRELQALATETPTSMPTTAPSKTPTSTLTSTSTPRPTVVQQPTKTEAPKVVASPTQKAAEGVKLSNDYILPSGSYSLGDNDHWATPPMKEDPCKTGSPTIGSLNVPYDPNKNYPWGEVRYTCTYSIKYGGWTAKFVIKYAPHP